MMDLMSFSRTFRFSKLTLLALLLFLDLLLQGDQVLRQFFFVLKNQSFLLLRLLLQHAV